MWQNFITLTISPLNLIVRAVVVYLFIIFLLRIAGKREIGQMGVSEFVAVLLISNAVQNSMNGGDNSLVGGMILALTLVVLGTIISTLTYRSKKIRRLVEGTPTLLVHKGKMLQANLKRERMNELELRMLLREQGFNTVENLSTVILEPNGTLSILKKEESIYP